MTFSGQVISRQVICIRYLCGSATANCYEMQIFLNNADPLDSGWTRHDDGEFICWLCPKCADRIERGEHRKEGA